MSGEFWGVALRRNFFGGGNLFPPYKASALPPITNNQYTNNAASGSKPEAL